MNPEWVRWIREGEIVVLILLGGAGLLMFKFLNKRCEQARAICIANVAERLSSLEVKVDLKLENMGNKIDTLLDRQKENHEILLKLINGGKK